MNIPCEPQSLSLSENEVCDIIVRQYSWAWSNFFMSLLPLFQLMNLYAMFSCPCNIKRFITINFISYTTLNYVRAWRKIFHAVTIKFQDLSWKFSFQAVIVNKICLPCYVYHIIVRFSAPGRYQRWKMVVYFKYSWWSMKQEVHFFNNSSLSCVFR